MYFYNYFCESLIGIPKCSCYLRQYLDNFIGPNPLQINDSNHLFRNRVNNRRGLKRTFQ